MKITRPTRKYLPQDLVIDSWETIEQFYQELLSRDINSKDNFSQWLKDISELDAVLEEDLAWRYIRMTIDTTDETRTKAYTFFVSEIQPKISPFEDLANRKLAASDFLSELESKEAYFIFFRSVKTALDLYREENISIQAEIAEESQQYGAISAAQQIEYNGETMTMQKAGLYLREVDESVREEVFRKMVERRSQDTDKLNELFNSLLKKRTQLAQNSGFDNFRDYKMQAMGRFDYSVEACEDFHRSVKSVIVPIVKEIQQKRLNLLGKSAFKPWDTEVDPEGKAPLSPFKSGEDLLAGTLEMFEKIDPYFKDCLQTMNEMGHLDLESKTGKAPGGYNYPLYEIGVPFIFMNAVGSHRDLVTMVHEGGHAVHSFLSRDLELTGFKSLPSEVAELASMSMELLTMEQWETFYKNEDELKRAKKEQLETVIKLLPWIAQVDEFQHWLYTNPNHSNEERKSKWSELNKEYGTGLSDYTGFEDYLAHSWQRQLHIFEVPFYYIEYGIAQLGALGVWKNSLEDKAKAIEDYKKALSLGYTMTIPEIYKTAGVEFNFSEAHIKALADFVREQLRELN